MICPKLKGFRIGHLNIASLMKHKDELSIFISKQPFDVPCINETRLDSSICNSEVEVAGDDLTRKDRNRNGGGVAIYARSVTPYINRTELSPDTAEAICLEIRKPKSKPLLVSTWYRPPGSKPELFNEFETFLKKINNENKEIVITGDFNCNMLNKQSNNNANTRLLLDLIDITTTYQHVNQNYY